MKTIIAAIILTASASVAFAQAEKADPGSLSGKAKEPTASGAAPSGNTGTSAGSSGKATPGGSDAMDSQPDLKTPNPAETDKTTKVPNEPK